MRQQVLKICESLSCRMTGSWVRVSWNLSSRVCGASVMSPELVWCEIEDLLAWLCEQLYFEFSGDVEVVMIECRKVTCCSNRAKIKSVWTRVVASCVRSLRILPMFWDEGDMSQWVILICFKATKRWKIGQLRYLWEVAVESCCCLGGVEMTMALVLLIQF